MSEMYNCTNNIHRCLTFIFTYGNQFFKLCILLNRLSFIPLDMLMS